MLIASGVGATVGPHVARRLAGAGNVAALRASVYARVALALVIGVLAAATSRGAVQLALMLPLTAVLTGAVVSSAVIQTTSRQTTFQGPLLSQVVGWGHSAAAGGTLAGTWIGLGLRVERNPIAGCAIASILSLAALTTLRANEASDPAPSRA